jgi:hypothetical protein
MREAYTYKAVLAASDRVCFRLDDVLREHSELDFTRPFMPDSLARSSRDGLLDAREQLLFNQIYAHTYLCMFGLVEEFILPFVLDHVRRALPREDGPRRALLVFASEEAKHIELFTRFRAAFERGFATRCEVVGPAQQVVDSVLAHSPLGVALTILHIEWMTQRHYVESVRSDAALEPQIANLLKQHWLEEAQHAKLDTLLAEGIAGRLLQLEIDACVDDYLAVIGELDGLLVAQSTLDVAALERARGAAFAADARARLASSHLAALRSTFVLPGMTHPSFLTTVAELSPRGAARVRERARAFAAA